MEQGDRLEAEQAEQLVVEDQRVASVRNRRRAAPGCPIQGVESIQVEQVAGRPDKEPQ